MDFEDFRTFLEFLERQREIVRIRKEVDPEHELGAVLRKVINETGPAVLFERVKGHSIPVVGSVLATRKRLALALRTTKRAAAEEWANRTKSPIQPKMVEDGPVQEVVLIGEKADLTKLPIPIHSPKDVGRYITAGVNATRKPNGKRNLGYNRMYIQGRDHGSIRLVEGGHFWMSWREAEEKGEPFPFATMIGSDIEVQLVGAASQPYDLDEVEIAGALKGRPVELVRCKSSDIEVCARAEIIVECETVPGERITDGPFADWAGYYKGNEVPVFRVKAITHRKDSIYQTLLPSIIPGMPPTDHTIITAIPREASLLEALRAAVPTVKVVYFTPNGCSMLNVVVSLKKEAEWQPRQVIQTALAPSPRLIVNRYGGTRGIMNVIVVDDDIDAFDLGQVEWAITMRCDPAEDLLVYPRMSDVKPNDPIFGKARLGIDATAPLGKPERERLVWPPESMEKIDTKWQEYVSD